MARNLEFDDASIARFKRSGFIKLQQLINAEEIEGLRRWCNEPIWTTDAPPGMGFANTTYRTGTKQTIFERLAEDDGLRATLRALAAERLIYTNGNRFTLTPEQSGTPWHFGRLSFCYIGPLTMGYSLWIPLDPINPADQHGGMAWVPTDVLSASVGYQMWAGYVQRVPGAPNRQEIEAARRKQFGVEYGFPMLGLYDRAYLDLVAETDGFEVGDALFFNKFLWHRTLPLRPGRMSQRTACVLRYVSENATFTPDLMRAATPDMDDRQRQECGIFGSYLVDLEPGSLIRTSAFSPEPR